jgi:hypothetical protein
MKPQKPAAGAAAFLLRRFHAVLPLIILIFAIFGLGMGSRAKSRKKS